jgi:hypothetical protein
MDLHKLERSYIVELAVQSSQYFHWLSEHFAHGCTTFILFAILTYSVYSYLTIYSSLVAKVSAVMNWPLDC